MSLRNGTLGKKAPFVKEDPAMTTASTPSARRYYN